MEILQADPWFRVFLYLKLDVMRIMRIIEGMRFKEIAEQTGVSINTALGRMRYALINLRRMIREKELILS